MNQMEKEFGLSEVHKGFNKNNSEKLRVECLSNYGIKVKKEYIKEITNILFDMVKNSFLKEIKSFSIEDMFNNNSSILFKTYLQHYSLESTTFSEAHFIVDYMDGFCLNIEKKCEISKIFLIKNKEQILKVLKNFLEDKETISIKKENSFINLLQFIFVTQINSGNICKNKKTYLKFSEFNFSNYLLNGAINNDNLVLEDYFSKIEIPHIIPNVIEEIDCSFSKLSVFMRRSNGFLDYITNHGAIRNDLKTRELKVLANEIEFEKLSIKLREKAYKDLLKKALNTKGISYLNTNYDIFKKCLINAILYYEQIVYNLNKEELIDFKNRLEE